MAKKNLTLNGLSKYYSDEDSARELLESLRWPNGAVCARCGWDEAYKLNPKPTSTRPVRKGVYKCKKCRKQFTVTVGTIFEDSHIPLHKWLQAISLMMASKKGMSALQLKRMLEISYKTAWFMAHRIRYAMQPIVNTEKLGGTVEIDETYIGGKRKKSEAWDNKIPVVALVERSGDVRAFVVPIVNAGNVREILHDNVDSSASIMSDEGQYYWGVEKDFASFEKVTHSKYEYARGDVSTNTIEGFFGLLKRGLHGAYHHVSKEHLHRYLTEFSFRYNTRKITDHERVVAAVKGFEGKRLMYK